MIVIGSYAAHLLGCLPPWREGAWADIDLLVQAPHHTSEMVGYHERGSRAGAAIALQADDGTAVGKWLDMTINPALYALVSPLTVADTEINGCRARVVGVEALWALTRAALALSPKAKVARDDAHFTMLVPHPSPAVLALSEAWSCYCSPYANPHP